MASKHIIKISGKFYGTRIQPDEPSNSNVNLDTASTPSVSDQPEVPVVPSESEPDRVEVEQPEN